jgi:hypothetical protein
MQAAPRTVGSVIRSSSPGRAVAGLLVVAFALVVAVSALGALARIGKLEDRRHDAPAAPPANAAHAGDVGSTLLRLSAGLQGRDRYALVFSPALDADTVGFDRLLALATLYPAIAVDDLRRADAVVVFGEPGSGVRSTFTEAASADGVWLGRRRP